MKRRRGVRRMLAGMFLFVAFMELGSHAIVDSQDPNAAAETQACFATENIPARADCPEQRRQRQETKNLLDEMTTHMVILNSMVVPHSGSLYSTGTNYAARNSGFSTDLNPPFHPPELS